jgi:hypothetical protein
MRLIATLVFYPMLWLRGFVLFLGRLVSGFASIAALVMLLVSAFTRHRFWLLAGMFGLCGFLTFLLLQLYDSILFRLNPTGRTLILYQ